MRTHSYRAAQFLVATLCWFAATANGSLRAGSENYRTSKRIIPKQNTGAVSLAQRRIIRPMNRIYIGAPAGVPVSMLQQGEHNARGFVGGALGQMAGGAMGAMGLKPKIVH